MEDGEIAPPHLPEHNNKIFSLGELLDEACAYYMLCGLDCDTFWNGDYTYFKHYVRCHEMEVEQRNQELWLQGVYIGKAFSVTISHAFGGKSGRDAKYPDKPYRITAKTEQEEEQEIKQTVDKTIAVLDKLAGRSKGANKKLGGETK